MLISSIEIIPNKRVTEHLGLVQGSTVRAKHAGKDIMAGFKNIFGGELASYTELLQESRDEAIERMSQQAEAIGANAVINVRFATSSIAAGASEILAYGTAVIMEDTTADNPRPEPGSGPVSAG
ncbi:MAG: YbjQ family protein [Halioglobus sp.]